MEFWADLIVAQNKGHVCQPAMQVGVDVTSPGNVM